LVCDRTSVVKAGAKSDLFATVVKILREDGVELKSGTEIMLRHEITMELEVLATKLRVYEEMISELGRRIGELEVPELVASVQGLGVEGTEMQER
jgi:hypothetical protein